MLSELVSITGLAAKSSITIAHTVGLRPDVVLPDRATPIAATGATATTVTFYNAGDTPQSAVFLLYRMHSVQGQVHSAGIEAPFLWAGGSAASGLLWTAIDSVTIVNSNVETTGLPASALGSRTLPAGYWAAGRMLRWETRGQLSVLGSGEVTTFRNYLDGTKFIESVGTMPAAGLVDAYVEAVLDIVCRRVVGTTATLYAIGRTLIKTATGVTTANLRELNSAGEFTVNSALAMDFDFTYQFTNASASNKLVLMTSDLRGLN